MRRSASILIFAAAAATAAAQQNNTMFECPAVGPIPAPPVQNCAFLSGVNASIETSTSCPGMPTEGAKYARVEAVSGGPYVSSLAPGAFVPRPLAAGLSELRVPFVTGTLFVRYDRQVYLSDSPPYNDGYDISVCDAAGNVLQRLDHGDAATMSTFACINAAGNQFMLSAPTPAGAYLSVAAFNVGDSCCGGTYVAIDQLQTAKDNDEPYLATVIGPCVSGPFSNAGATTSPNVNCQSGNDVWYRYDATVSGVHAFSTVGLTGDDTVINLASGPGSTPFACNDDAFGGTYASSVSAPLTAGQSVWISVGGWSGGNVTFSLRVSPPPPAQLAFFAPLQGTVSVCVANATPNSLYFAPMTLVQGAYPNGSFFGLDISLIDALLQIGAGAPFFGVTDAAGMTPRFGPYGPGLSGITIYAVMLDDVANPGFTASPPQSFTIP